MTIGLQDLYYSVIKMENDVEEYSTPKVLSKAMKADLTVNTAEAKLYADDALDESANEFINATLKLGIKDLNNEVLKEILGQEIDSNGILWAGDDEPPYLAIGFRAKKGNGTYRYVWLLRGKFKLPNEAFETKGESITYKTPEIEGTFSKAHGSKKWKADYTGKETSEVASEWFKKVPVYDSVAEILPSDKTPDEEI